MKTLMGSLSPHPSVEGGGLVCHPPLHRAGFPPAVRFPCADERGGGWSSMEGCLLDLTRQLRSQAASFPTVAKKPQQPSQLPKQLFSTFFFSICLILSNNSFKPLRAFPVFLVVKSWASTMLGMRVCPWQLFQEGSNCTGCFHMWSSGSSLH